MYGCVVILPTCCRSDVPPPCSRRALGVLSALSARVPDVPVSLGAVFAVSVESCSRRGLLCSRPHPAVIDHAPAAAGPRPGAGTPRDPDTYARYPGVCMSGPDRGACPPSGLSVQAVTRHFGQPGLSDVVSYPLTSLGNCLLFSLPPPPVSLYQAMQDQ